jgi:hypothetical protein
MRIDLRKVAFVRGMLISLAATDHPMLYDQFRRLSRLNDEQMGRYLDLARRGRGPGEPDFCSFIITTGGEVSWGWGDPQLAEAERIRAHAYWRDRMTMDNADFRQRYDRLPSIPGTLRDPVHA